MLNLWIAMSSMDILIIFILLIYDHGISFQGVKWYVGKIHGELGSPMSHLKASTDTTFPAVSRLFISLKTSESPGCCSPSLFLYPCHVVSVAHFNILDGVIKKYASLITTPTAGEAWCSPTCFLFLCLKKLWSVISLSIELSCHGGGMTQIKWNCSSMFKPQIFFHQGCVWTSLLTSTKMF